MGTINEKNQHFVELRQKVCLYIHIIGLVVLIRGLPSLDGKLEHYVIKSGISSYQAHIIKAN